MVDAHSLSQISSARGTHEKGLVHDLGGPGKSSQPEATLIVGSGRSGTTWLSAVLNYDGSYRRLFEPFNGRRIETVEHFVYHSQYLRPSCSDPLYTEPIRTILRGEIAHPWVDGEEKSTAPRLLIKAIRAHLFVRWIKDNFPETPIILLLRHPCAVAVSRIALGWGTHLDELLGQAELVEDFLRPIEDKLRKVRGVFEEHICTWAIENYVPLTQFGPHEIHVLFYEHLCSRFEKEVEKTFYYLCRNPPPEQSLDQLKRRSSPLSRPESAIVRGGDLLRQWRGGCSSEQVERAVEILSWFGLDRIYAEQAMPIVEDGSQIPGDSIHVGR